MTAFTENRPYCELLEYLHTYVLNSGSRKEMTLTEMEVAASSIMNEREASSCKSNVVASSAPDGSRSKVDEETKAEVKEKGG